MNFNQFWMASTQPMMGTDPELFLMDRESGEIVGSELAIPEAGLWSKATRTEKRNGEYVLVEHPVHPAIVRDGVQAELQPMDKGFSCRESLAEYIRNGLLNLERHLAETPYAISWAEVVTVEPHRLLELSEKSRILGCMPSFNIYGPSEIGVPGDHPVRSAGGHLHLGMSPGILHKQPAPLVWLLDAIVGNTMVLLDRDPRAAERREVYGRAGEFRLPPHGLEYRTLSNFWLRAYPLHSLVWAAVRFATTCWAFDRGKDFLSRVDLDLVRAAINGNDAEKAQVTLEILHAYQAEIIAGMSPEHREAHQDGAYNALFLPEDLGMWNWFVGKGIEHFWPTDTLSIEARWTGPGWERFQRGVLADRFARSQQIKVA
jgi:hypothetical protein